ncbi:unnamed protein product [Rotaria socialis]|uniref:Uncharacterized protein n=1 Tax=Rotaria socialis TaxID=392032 RepID=A0A818JFQ0_9BILA|nr:unnamed protein product [Rotaria socialis]
MCAVVDDNELQFNGIHEDNCVNHGQTHVVPEPLVTRTIYGELRTVFGDEAPSNRIAIRWAAWFREG